MSESEKHQGSPAVRRRHRAFCRHRRHRHVGHRRSDEKSRLRGARVGRYRKRERAAPARQGHCDRHRPRGEKRRRRRRGRRLDGDPPRQSRNSRGARAAYPGRSPRRHARRADAAEMDDFGRGNARQDDDDDHGRGAPRRSGARSDRHQWRRHQRLWNECAHRRGRLDGRRGGRIRRLVPAPADDGRGRHQHRPRTSRPLGRF